MEENIQWKYTKENPLRVVSTFSGYDSQFLSLDYIGIPWVCVAWSEIEPNAIKAHNALYPQYADKNLGDISKIDWSQVPDFDLFTYSFPCTDLSNAGRQAGFEEGSGTRSSLLWECKKAIDVKHPKYLLMENVKAMVSDKFLPGYKKWINYLFDQGYVSFAKVINSKSMGIPQNRERIFVVSILDGDWYNFPQEQELKLKLKDMLEEKVDEKYYLDDKKVAEFIGTLDKSKIDKICE